MPEFDFDFEAFCAEHRVGVADSSDKHFRDGWVNVGCPFCGSQDGRHHLGFHAARHYFYCWRCGWKPGWEVVMGLLGVSRHEAQRVIRQFPARPTLRLPSASQKDRPEKVCRLPFSSGDLAAVHRRYLASRGFDADKLTSEWGLRGVGPLGGAYKWRVVAPIFLDGVLVSYQARDVTGKATPPYRACAEADEVRRHKDCLYGFDRVVGDTVVVVEGITDVWRLGAGAVATFGTQFSDAQVRLIASFSRRFVLYDSYEVEALQKANALAATVASLTPSGETYVLQGESPDPAEMPQDEADAFMREIMTP